MTRRFVAGLSHLSWGTGLLGLWLVGALWTDLRQRRIPNPLVWSGLLVAGALHVWQLTTDQPSLAGTAWAAPVWGLIVAAAAGLPGYLRSVLAAGDVKLMALVGAFVGPAIALWAALFTMLAGGLQSLAWWGWYRLVRNEPAAPMPYAPSIAAGAAAALWVWGAGPIGITEGAVAGVSVALPADPSECPRSEIWSESMPAAVLPWSGGTV